MAHPPTPTAKLQATAEGAILFDEAAVGGAFDDAWFDPAYWTGRGSAQPLGAGRGTAIRIADGGRDWVLRHYHRGGMIAALLGDRYLWGGADRTRGFVEFRLLAELVRRGLHAPAPIAARYRRDGAHYRADLVTRYISGTHTLAERLRDGTLDAALATRVGAGIAEFQAAGVHHADLNAHNVLTDPRAVWLIDFDRGALRAPARAWQVANLMRLRRSLLKLGAARDGETRFDREVWQPLMAGWERTLGATQPQAASGGSRG